MYSNKEYRIAIRLSADLNNQMERLIKLFQEKTCIKVSKTAIITSALEEGFKILEQRLNDSK